MKIIENSPTLGTGGPNPFVPMEDPHPMFPTLVDMRVALERVVVITPAIPTTTCKTSNQLDFLIQFPLFNF